MIDFRLLRENFYEVFSRLFFVLMFFLVSGFIGIIFYYFSNYDLLIGNYGEIYFMFDIGFQVLISILFGLFFSASVYKIVKFNSFSFKENTAGFFGGLLGLLVTGCAACSISIASYVGLAGLIAVFPFGGIELKIISIPMLFYSNYIIFRDLNLCYVKKSLKK